MVADALKGYIQLANGLTDVTKDRASATAKSLAAQSPDLLGTAASTAASTAVSTAVSTAMSAAVQVQSLAEDFLVASRDNRALLMGLIRTEVERLVTALGFAKESEVDAVRHKVDKLEETVDGLADGSPKTPTLRAALTPTKKPAPSKAVAKKTATKKPTTKKAPARSTAKKAATKSATKAATKSAPSKGTSTKSAAKKPATAKKAPPVAPVVAAEAGTPVPAPAPAPAATGLVVPAASAVSTPATPLVPAAPVVETPAPAPEIVDLTRATIPVPASSGDGSPE